jgi:hypothetical protein
MDDKLVPFRMVVTAMSPGPRRQSCVLPCMSRSDRSCPLAPEAIDRPATEETAKAIFIVWLLLRRRLGFSVDAAIAGFAVGAGCLAENLEYLGTVDDTRIWRGSCGAGDGDSSRCHDLCVRDDRDSVWERQPGRRLRAIATPGWRRSRCTPVQQRCCGALAATLVLLAAADGHPDGLPQERGTTQMGWRFDLDLELLQLIESMISSHEIRTYLRA